MRKSEKHGKINTTIFIDLDGVLIKHAYDNFEQYDILDLTLEKLSDFKKRNVYLILTTGRSKRNCSFILKFFKDNGIIFDRCIFDLPTCRRILINDDKYIGIKKALAYSYPRNYGIKDFNDY